MAPDLAVARGGWRRTSVLGFAPDDHSLALPGGTAFTVSARMTVIGHEPSDRVRPVADIQATGQAFGAWRANVKARVVATVRVIVTSLIVCAAPTAQANVYHCSGWADGPRGARLDAWISPEAVDFAHAEWTPPHSGMGPMSIRLTYGVRGRSLAKLTRMEVEGEIAPGDLATEGAGYIVVTPVGGAIWREPFRADPEGLAHLDNDARTPFASVVVASNYPVYAGEPLVRPERLVVVERARSLLVTAFGQGDRRFSDDSYDLSDRQERDRLFRLAYDRAARGFTAGCAAADAMCECGG